MSPRRIIHLDMDCFYAAVEEREQPELRGRPVAVGGSSGRGVLTTANYLAREFGCRSAMPVHEARRLCPQLILLPVRFDLYREVSRQIRALMRSFTPLVEPLSLDEAYLDVSQRREPAAEIARHLRDLIREDLRLTASAGIGPNKLIAKIASDQNKPDGQCEVRPEEVENFLRPLPVSRLWGVGPRSAQRLQRAGFQTCGDLAQAQPQALFEVLGRHGLELRELARGLDSRPVTPQRERKSASVESTFHHNLQHLAELDEAMNPLFDELQQDLAQHHAERQISALVVKLKFADFTSTTAERASPTLDRGLASELLAQARARQPADSVRLLGIGVKFTSTTATEQLDLF